MLDRSKPSTPSRSSRPGRCAEWGHPEARGSADADRDLALVEAFAYVSRWAPSRRERCVENVIELEVGEGRQVGLYTVRVLRSPTGGDQTGTFALDVGELLARRPHLEATVLSSSVPARRVMSVHERPVREMGQQLFESVFAGSVGGAYRASLAVARERQEGLQVVLRLTAPGLGALPWETLYDPEIGAYLCRKEPLIRHVPSPYTPEALKAPQPLRILGMVASPRGLPPLDVEAEQQHLDKALRPHLEAGAVDLVWLADVSFAGVHAALLQHSWHVLHFVGHGGYDTTSDEGLLAFVGADGRADYVEASRLADLLNESKPTPRLVVLNSCSSGTASAEDLFSGTAATLVHSGIHAVAAMQFAISDGAAIAFARAFYTAIAHGRSIDDAVRSGRIGILGNAKGTLEWVTPVLYRRGGTTPLFEMTSERQRNRVNPTVDDQQERDPDEPAAAATATRAPRAPAESDEPAAAATATPVPTAPAESDEPAAAATATPAPTAPAESDEPAGQDESPSAVADRRAAGQPRRWIALVIAGVAVLALIGLGVLLLLRPSAVTVSTTVDVPGNQAFVDTTVACTQGQVLDITATGTVLHNAATTSSGVGPDGAPDPALRQFNVAGLPNANHAALIGSLDRNAPFVVASTLRFTCPTAGELFLGVNDVGVANNSGAFSATITKSRSG